LTTNGKNYGNARRHCHVMVTAYDGKETNINVDGRRKAKWI